MSKRVFPLIIFILFASLLAWAQFSLIGAWPGPFRQLNLIIIVLVFILFFFDFRAAAWAALLFGFWLDTLSFQFFGLCMISLLLSVGLGQLLLKNWLTNRSLYSFLVLIFLTTVVYNFLLLIFSYAHSLTSGNPFLVRPSFWLALVYQLAWSLLAALLLFHLTLAASRKWQPLFLEKKT